MTTIINTGLYHCNINDTEQYLLGHIPQPNNKKLSIYIGAYPHTDSDQGLQSELQQTLAQQNTHNWCLMHLYPVRTSQPQALDEKLNKTAHKKNLDTLSQFLEHYYGHTIQVWAAWGEHIKERHYLLRCLNELSNLIPSHASWYWLEPNTNETKLRPPVLLGDDLELQELDINGYLDRNT